MAPHATVSRIVQVVAYVAALLALAAAVIGNYLLEAERENPENPNEDENP